MMDPGEIFIYLALLTSVFSFTGFIEGVRRREGKDLSIARVATKINALFVTIASIFLFYYFLTGDFNVRYVAYYSDRALPLIYKISAFWAGSEGSMLLWAWILSLFLAGVALVDRKDRLSGLALGIMMSVEIFFLLLVSTVLNPFERLDFIPVDGQGLNPLLIDPGIAAHPVTLFIGYAGLTIPFAYAIAGILLEDERWIFRVRKWTLFSWIFLTLGIAFGAEWAYTTLGWGGFWAWDPVENSSLLPWLTSTAFMHSIMIQEARRGMKLWNILLAFGTFEFVIFGTFLTRSGVISSVHSFGQSNVGPIFTIYMALIMVVTAFIIYRKYHTLKSLDIIESMLSRESTFLLNNLILVVGALTIFWGTIFPLISEAVKGYKITVGPPFYNMIEIPLAIGLVILMGLCITVSWRRFDLKKFAERVKYPAIAGIAGLLIVYLLGAGIIASTGSGIFLFVVTAHLRQYVIDYREFSGESGGKVNPLKVILRKRRRYGGYIVHMGIFLIFLGVMGAWMYDTQHEVTLTMGDSKTIQGYTFKLRDIQFNQYPNKKVWTAKIDVIDGNGLVGSLSPRIEEYLKTNQDTVRVGILSSPSKDIYIILDGLNRDTVFLKIKFIPLISLVWAGVIVMIAGTVIGLVPKRKKEVI